jgi:hypothetical protein
MEASAVDAVAVSPVTCIPVRVIGQPEQAAPPAIGIDCVSACNWGPPDPVIGA